ncbi:MAG: hypothetical protein IJA85_07700 [Clostridia bacterium]|nr:hypothetical protein [Clostridia bacterium]
MKKFSRLALVFMLVFAILAMSVSAGTVIYQNGGANATNTDEDDNIPGAQYGGDDFEGFLVYEMSPEVLGEKTFDLSNADYVYVRFYVENPDNYEFGKGASLEISSAGKCDVEETNWALDNFEFEEGWNEIAFDLYDTTGNGADLSKINYVRFFWYSVGANTNVVDYVGFGGEDEDFSSVKTEIGQLVKEEKAKEDNYNRYTKDDDDNKAPVDGLAAVQGTFDLTPVDVSKYTHAFIRVYMEGVDNFTGNGQLEITSKLNDAQELTWNIGSGVEFVEGWNEIKLALDENEGDSGFDPTNCKFYRIYMFNEGGLLIDLDYIGFGNESDSFSENLPVYLLKPASQEPAEEPETDAPAADAPAADAPAADAPATPSAPATADMGIVAAAAVLAIAAGAIVVSKKR